MIAAQKEALEAARRSREDALKATKVREMSRFVLKSLRLLNADQKQFPRIHEPWTENTFQV